MKGGGRSRALPLPFPSSASNEIENFLRESYDDATGDSQHTIRPLRGVVALEG